MQARCTSRLVSEHNASGSSSRSLHLKHEQQQASVPSHNLDVGKNCCKLLQVRKNLDPVYNLWSYIFLGEVHVTQSVLNMACHCPHPTAVNTGTIPRLPWRAHLMSSSLSFSSSSMPFGSLRSWLFGTTRVVRLLRCTMSSGNSTNSLESRMISCVASERY